MAKTEEGDDEASSDTKDNGEVVKAEPAEAEDEDGMA